MANDPIVAQLRPDQVQEITTAFMEFDGNRNGYITPQEMRECLRRSGIQHQDAEVDRVMANMDTNHDGSVSYDEYMKFMARVYTGQLDQRGPPAGGAPNPPYGNYPPQNNQNPAPYNSNQPQGNYPPPGSGYNPSQNYPQGGGNYPPQQNNPQGGGNYPPQQNNPQGGGNYPPQQNYPQGGGNYPPPQGSSYNQPQGSNYPPRNY